MRYFSADSATDTGVVHFGDRIGSKPIVARLDGERRAARKANARMIAGAKIFVYSEALPDDTFTLLDQRPLQGGDASLAIELTFAVGDDHFRARKRGAEGLPQCGQRTSHIIGMYRTHPFHSDPSDGDFDGMPSGAVREIDLRGGNVLPACCGCKAIVDDDRYSVVLVEYRVGDA